MPGFFGVGRVEHLDRIVVLLGPADVHPHQHLGPVRRVHAARTRADVEQRLALVVLAGQQRADLHRLDVLVQLLVLGVGLGFRFARPCSFFFGGHLVEHRQVVEALPKLLDAAQLTLGVGQLAGDLLRPGLVVPQVGVGGLVFELLDPAAQSLDVEHPLHRGQGGVQGGEVGLTVRIHGSSGYLWKIPTPVIPD